MRSQLEPAVSDRGSDLVDPSAPFDSVGPGSISASNIEVTTFFTGVLRAH